MKPILIILSVDEFRINRVGGAEVNYVQPEKLESFTKLGELILSKSTIERRVNFFPLHIGFRTSWKNCE